jgi:hypothetical protein
MPWEDEPRKNNQKHIDTKQKQKQNTTVNDQTNQKRKHG